MVECYSAFLSSRTILYSLCQCRGHGISFQTICSGGRHNQWLAKYYFENSTFIL